MGIDGEGDAFRLSVKHFFLHLPIVPLSWCGCLTMLLPLLTRMANCLHGLYERAFLFFSQSNRNESSYCGIAHITRLSFPFHCAHNTVQVFIWSATKWNPMKINLISFQLIVGRFAVRRGCSNMCRAWNKKKLINDGYGFNVIGYNNFSNRFRMISKNGNSSKLIVDPQMLSWCVVCAFPNREFQQFCLMCC